MVTDFVTPVRERTQELLDDQAELERVLAAGAAPRPRGGLRHRRRGLRPGRLPGRRAAGDARVNDDTFVPRGRCRRRRPPSSASSSRSRSRGPSCWSTGGPRSATPRPSLVPPHVTLLPPTEVAVADRPAISGHLAEVARRHAPFDMHLAGTGTFAPVSDVVFVAVARGIGNCELIANDVRRGPLSAVAGLPVPPARHRGPRRARRHARAGLQRAGRPVGRVPRRLVHRVRADPARGLGGRPRVPAHRSAPLTWGAPARAEAAGPGPRLGR